RTISQARSSVLGRYILSQRLNHLPPLTPSPRAANMRSVHTVVSTQFQPCGLWASDSCLAFCTDESPLLVPDMTFTHPLSYPTSLLTALLTVHPTLSHVCGTPLSAPDIGTIRAVTPAERFTTPTGIPA